MSAGSSESRAASAALAAEVAKKVRERCLVVWLDADRKYAGFIDALARGEFGFSYPVVTFRDSYLELMMALEPYGNDPRPEHLLIHLPGLNKETVKETPIYELYKAGITYEKNLETLVREAAVGSARPDEVDAFVRAPGLSLDGADRWLADRSAEPRDGLELLLDNLGLDDVVVGLINDDPRLRGHLPGGGEKGVGFLERGLGLNPAWRRYRIGDSELKSPAMATLVASWLMAVEFVHDLRDTPVTPELVAIAKLGPFAKKCRELVAHFRETQPDSYELFANELQEQLEQERTSHHASALGSIDTFRFEEAAMRAAAIGALGRSEWAAAEEIARERTPEKCFWVRRSPALQRTWEIVRQAATTGSMLVSARKGLDRCGSLEEAVERYADKLAPVDRQHRLFEQRSHALLSSDLEDYDALLDARAAVRQGYRDWANGINRSFYALCVTHGPLPGRSMRQRTIYEEVVQPLLDRGERVAFFMVDAMRFEMAQALAAELHREKYRTHLTARLGELPTETATGMNALAPVARNGRLRPAVRDGKVVGFVTGEFSVTDPAGRVRAMSQRSLTAPAEDIELKELRDATVTQLKRRLNGKPPLVVVRSRELDTAGEHSLHLGTFDHTLALLKSAVSLLSQAGVDSFVMAADHGFLMQDATVESIPFGVGKRVPERRHALLREPSGMPDALEVRLSDLEYDVDEDAYLVFRPDTAVWATTNKIAPFVHGGNSLQERVIPVLVVDRQTARGRTMSRYEVVARPEPARLGRQRLRVCVRLQTRANASLPIVAPKAISLALRVKDRSDVAVTLLDAEPPASLSEGRLLVPPNRDEALVEFEIQADVDDKVRVEIYHPDAVEDVAPKVVDGFFDAVRSRRLPRPARGGDDAAPVIAATSRVTTDDWAGLIEDEGYRRVVTIIAERRSINEFELAEVLGSPRRVRAFARHFDQLVRLLPFAVEVITVQGMKAYARKD